ncbi:hypothetical protein ACW9KT_22245 [Hymenobacter sp. HD11105]
MPRLAPYFRRHPQQLFLLDGGGALLSAGCLGVVTLAFAERFGLPRPVLLALTVLAGGYAVFSLSCFYLVREQWRRWLTLVWRGNVLYCGLVVGGVCGYFYRQLTPLGAVYFLGEALIILALAALERRVTRFLPPAGLSAKGGGLAVDDQGIIRATSPKQDLRFIFG